MPTRALNLGKPVQLWDERDPSTTDDTRYGYRIGFLWFNTLTAVLWQLVDDTRNAALWLPIGSGDDNQATGLYALAIGGRNIDASGTRAIAIGGSTNTVSGSDAAAIGGANNGATGDATVVLGGASNGAHGDGSVASGYGARVLTDGQVGIGGRAGTRKAQASICVLGGATSGATPANLVAAADVAGSAILIDEKESIAVQALVIGRQTNASANAMYTITAIVHRPASGSATIVGKTVTALHEDDAGWTVDLVAVGSTGFTIEATGASGDNVAWAGNLRLAHIVDSSE